MNDAVAKSQLFVLDEANRPVRAESLQAWASYMEQPHRVGKDKVNGLTISTVFMGLGGNVLGCPRPFETIVMRGDEKLAQAERYETWDAARRGHARWVKELTHNARKLLAAMS